MLKKTSLILAILLTNASPAFALSLKANNFYLYDITNESVLASKCDKEETLIDGKHALISFLTLEHIKKQDIDPASEEMVGEFLGQANPKLSDVISTQILWNSNDANQFIEEKILGGPVELVSKVEELKKKYNFKFDNSKPFMMNACEIAHLYENMNHDMGNLMSFFDLESFEFNNSSHPNQNSLGNSKDVVGLYQHKAGKKMLAVFKIKKGSDNLIGSLLGNYESEDEIVQDAKELSDHTKANSTFINFGIDNEKLPNVTVHYGHKDHLKIKVDGTFKQLSNEFTQATSAKAILEIPVELNAPIARGDKVGTVIITSGRSTYDLDVIADENILESNIIERIKINLR